MFSVNSNIYSIVITSPTWSHFRPAGTQNDNPCYPAPIVTGESSPQYIQVRFNPQTSNFNYFVNLKVNGIPTYTSQQSYQSNNDEVTVNIEFTRFCYNVTTQIEAVVIDNSGTNTHSRYVRVYSQYQSNACPSGIGERVACWNRSSTLLGNYSMSIVHGCCTGPANQNCAGQRYRIMLAVNGNFQNKEIRINNNLTYGASSSPQISACTWGGVYSSSPTEVVFYTFVYYITLSTGQRFWWPCKPEEAAVVYTVHDIPPPEPPVISDIRQSPSNISQNTGGIMRATLSQGNSHGICYQWTSFNRPSFMWDDAATNTTNAVNIYNFGGSGPQPNVPQYYFRCRAVNSYGWDEKLSPNVIYSNNGGCPYIYVQNEDSFYIQDNNILHRSEFADFINSDITDKYHLSITPGIFNDRINFKIIELNNHYSYLDKIDLLAIDHPEDKNLGITENGDIVVYKTNDIVSSEHSVLNTDSNITKYIYYGHDSVVNGEGDDGIVLDNLNNTNYSGDSLAFILKVGRNYSLNIPNHIVTKDWAGSISVYLHNDPRPIVKSFSRRENMSVILIPFAGVNTSVDSAVIAWNRDFSVDYVSIVPIYYSGFNQTELLLIEAYHPNDIDAYLKLLDIDGNYIELDSLYQLELSFNSIEAPNQGYLRSYVLQTTGQYNTGNYLMHFTSQMPNHQILPYKNKLSQNYPNPFNPVTKINYEISKPSTVKLTIYNMLGQVVVKLVDEFKNPGIYETEFDGSNLPSGLYIYKIETPYFTESKKMVLIK